MRELGRTVLSLGLPILCAASLAAAAPEGEPEAAPPKCDVLTKVELESKEPSEGAVKLVFDVRLGAMSGFELYERLRESGTAPPVVFITAHDDWATRERARRAGAVQYLRKPFEEAALIDALSRATAQTRTA